MQTIISPSCKAGELRIKRRSMVGKAVEDTAQFKTITKRMGQLHDVPTPDPLVRLRRLYWLELTEAVTYAVLLEIRLGRLGSITQSITM